MMMMIVIVAMRAGSAQGNVVRTLVGDDKYITASKRTASKIVVRTNIGLQRGGNFPSRDSDCRPR